MNHRVRVSLSCRRLAQVAAVAVSVFFVGRGSTLLASNNQVGESAAQVQIGSTVTKFVVEIKEHSKTNAQNNIDRTQGPTDFARGDSFVIDGTIYPDGTIPAGHSAEPIAGTRPLGRYVQRGVFTAGADQFTRAVRGDRDVDPIIEFATEVLVFTDGSTLLVDGLWPNAYFAVQRAVLGGTGRFRDAVGEVLEENIGEDMDGVCNLRMTFRIRKAATSNGNDR